MKKTVEETLQTLIKEHVAYCRRNMSWNGENTVVVKKIVKIIKKEVKRNE